jgi:hypothetical protein
MIEVLGIKNADKLVPIDDDMTPRDPVSENMSFLTGKPTKAFIYQDHDAHIAVHTSMMQDPIVMGQIGQNPMAQQIQAAIMAHVAEHLAFQYRQKIQEQLGATLPAPDAALDNEAEVQISKLVAQAATQLLQMDKAKVAQQQAMAQAQDPIIQMQQAELQIKQLDAQTKAQKVQGELALKQQELQLKAQEMAARQGESPEILAAKQQQEMVAAQQAQQLQTQQQVLKMQQQEMAHRQKLSHNERNTQQKLTHAERQAQQRARLTEMQAQIQADVAAKQAANKPKGE